MRISPNKISQRDEVSALPSAAPSSESPATILVVDDRADVAGAIADLCRALGVAAVVSRPGETVRDMLRAHRPRGIIVDIMMPDEDGFEALREVGAHDRRLPVLLITGHGESWLTMGAALGRAHGLEAVSTSRKPIRVTALGEFIAVVRDFAAAHPSPY